MPRELPVPLPLISLERIMTENPLPITWVVESILAKGDRMVLFGEFGSMKSWLLLDLGLSIAGGGPWLYEFRVPESRKVLYIDEEMNLTTLWRRMRQLGQGAGYALEGQRFQALSQLGVTFDSNGAQKLLEALRASNYDPDVIIVETFRRVMVGSENEAQDVAAFWRHVEPIRRIGKTLVISHHMRKPFQQGRDDSRNRASGSTDILAGGDTGYAIQRKGKNVILVECVKSRVAEEAPPFFVSLLCGTETQPAHMSFEGYQQTQQQTTGELQRAIQLAEAQVLSEPDRPWKTSEIVSYLQAQGISDRTATRTLTELVGLPRGRVRRARRGYYQAVQETEPRSAASDPPVLEEVEV